jgi:hypothetical protein
VANHGKKKDLRELTSRWTSVCDNQVLNNFEPHDGLQVLKIFFMEKVHVYVAKHG